MKIKINGTEITDYLVNDLTFNLDSVSSTFSLSLPYFEYWPISKELFRPLKFQKVEIWDNSGKVKFLTGTIINNTKKATSNGVDLAVSGYSLPGVLDDCAHLPTSSPMSNNASLKEIAEYLIKPFGITLIIDSSVEAKCAEIYEKQEIKSSETIASYLSKLCTAKNVLITSNSEGNLVFTQVDIKAKPVLDISLKNQQVRSIGLECNGQGMHSIIQVDGEANLYESPSTDKEKKGETGNVNNSLISPYRPSFISQGNENTTVTETVKAALANELQNIKLTVELSGWNFVDDELILPGAIISITSPQVGLYKKTNFLIKNIALKEDSKSKLTTFTCVIPEALTGETPTIEL